VTHEKSETRNALRRGAIGQFWKRLDSIIAVNGGHVKHCVHFWCATFYFVYVLIINLLHFCE